MSGMLTLTFLSLTISKQYSLLDLSHVTLKHLYHFVYSVISINGVDSMWIDTYLVWPLILFRLRCRKDKWDTSTQ